MAPLDRATERGGFMSVGWAVKMEAILLDLAIREPRSSAAAWD